MNAHQYMSSDDNRPLVDGTGSVEGSESNGSLDERPEGMIGSLPPIVVATILREVGITGVQSYINRLRQYLDERGMSTSLVTPFSWGRALTGPVFGLRLALRPLSRTASTVWYRHWHEVFLYRALRRRLAELDDCIVYAQGPLAARAALRARRGPHQRVVLAVHFRISQADEWADKEEIERGGPVFRAIRQLERDVIPRVDGLVYVSNWARDALLQWLPEAAAVPSTVIGCMVTPLRGLPIAEPLADLVTIGNLDIVKNHRFLLEVVAEAERAGRTLTLDVYGEGPLEHELLAQRKSLGLDDRVRFRGFRSDVRRYLGGYRAYVHACYSESFCLAIVEAMESGLPVLAGAIGPVSELYDDGRQGRYWPLDDPAAAARMLVDLLDSEDDRALAAAAARERFHSHFDADLLVPRLLSFLAGTAAAAEAPREAADSVSSSRS